jgi:hypothetical protein
VLTGPDQWQNRFPRSRRASFDGSPQTCLLPLNKALPAQGTSLGPRCVSPDNHQATIRKPVTLARMTDAKLVACLEAYSRVKLRTVAG